jgi:lipoprotein NlpD
MIIKNTIYMSLNPLSSFKRQNITHFSILANWVTSSCAVVLLLSLAACSGFVAVEDKFSPSTSARNIHVVQKSETLFSLAWRYGWDYKELASANSIASPYLIFPGQKINVKRSRQGSVRSKPVSSKNLTKHTRSSSKPRASAYKTRNKAPKTVRSTADLAWSWPANGKITARFSTKSPTNKGIDIGGSLGESVTAAAAGSVVYAGSGLLGYGNLVIIKHNEQFLSAYAHNKRLLVKENQTVKAGQSIAKIGSSGTDKVKLHFEIRREGKPVNPMLYLPKARN